MRWAISISSSGREVHQAFDEVKRTPRTPAAWHVAQLGIADRALDP